jgi:hypothetical protein
MKLILERWRKLLEGDILQFPTQPRVSDEDILRVISLETAVADLLNNIYGNQSEIPIDVIERMDALVDAVEGSLKK